MRVMTPHSIPIFLRNSGIGFKYGSTGAQIRNFDVYFISPIIVGFHVLGNPTPCLPSISFELEEQENAPNIVGFYGQYVEIIDILPELIVEESGDGSAQVIGFYAIYTENFAPLNLYLEELLEEDSPQLIGFFVEYTPELC
jgi:hypothetical protein